MLTFVSIAVVCVAILVIAGAVASRIALRKTTTLLESRFSQLGKMEENLESHFSQLNKMESHFSQLNRMEGNLESHFAQLNRMEGNLESHFSQLKKMEGKLTAVEQLAKPAAGKRPKPSVLVNWGPDGHIARVKLSESSEKKFLVPPSELVFDEPLNTNDAGLFRLIETTNGIAFARTRVPDHVIHNADKKIDILGEWNGDFARLSQNAILSGNTHLREDRLYTLWQALKNTVDLSDPILEVGVWRGGSTHFLAEGLSSLGGNNRKIYACDTFTGHAHVESDLDGQHEVGGFGDSVDYNAVRSLLSPYPNVEVIRGDIQVTGGAIGADFFSLMHFDVDLHGPTAYCLRQFGTRCRAGGMILVDDYGFGTCPGVKVAVDHFVAEEPRFSMLHLASGQALLIPRE